MVSINDVAKRCKVSKSTVSKALNGSGNLRDETRDRVREIAKQMNYIPNMNAQGLKSKKHYLIGILFAEKKETGLLHGFYSRLIEHFRRMVSTQGFDIVFMSDNFMGQSVNLLEKSVIRGLDAILLITYDGRKEILDLYRANIPIICTDRSDNYFHTIVSDDYQGAKLATDHLISLHHKSIVHLAGPEYSRTAHVRVKGYIDAMKEARLSPSVVHTEHYSFESAYLTTKKLLQNDLPHAIFAASDMIAMGVFKAIKEAGHRIPEDISVVGYDGEPEFEFSNPPLTTIFQEYETIGKIAGDNLIQMINGTVKTIEEHLIDVKLIVRGSTMKREIL